MNKPAALDDKLYAALAYAGALPFIGCAILPWLGIATLPVIGDCKYISATYGVAIASFMAGIHWGTYLYRSGSLPVNLLLTSNVITLGVWFAFLLTPINVSLAANLVAFAALLAIDYKLAGAGLISDAYMALRRNVTVIVLVSLGLTIIS